MTTKITFVCLWSPKHHKAVYLLRTFWALDRWSLCEPSPLLVHVLYRKTGGYKWTSGKYMWM